MWCLRGEELFTSFGGNGSIIQRQDDVADGDLPCSLMLLNLRRKIVLLNISGPIPRSKESVFPKVSVEKRKISAIFCIKSIKGICWGNCKAPTLMLGE